MRHVLILDLVDEDDAIQAYREWQRAGGPPAAVTRAIREGGVSAMEIWHVGDRLVMVMETTPSFDPVTNAERDAHDPDVRAWEALMDRFQRRLPFADKDVKWVEAERIYELAAQP